MIELLLRIGGIVFPVFAIAAVGALWGRRHRPDMSVVNRLNVEVFAPALVFWALADKPLDFDLYRDLAIGGIAVVLGSGLLLWPFVRLAGIDARTFIPPMMFNNSGNMGIPLALFAFGETALQAAVVLFIIEMVLHFTVGLYILDHRTRPWRLLKMPMIQATIAGLAHAPRLAPPVRSGGEARRTLTRRDGKYLLYSWFVGFAPAQHPKIAFAVLLGNGDSRYVRAHQVAKDLLHGYFRGGAGEGRDLLAKR
mgnify:CR=1 FL=1